MNTIYISTTIDLHILFFVHCTTSNDFILSYMCSLNLISKMNEGIGFYLFTQKTNDDNRHANKRKKKKSEFGCTNCN